jgi:hypothetical protein
LSGMRIAPYEKERKADYPKPRHPEDFKTEGNRTFKEDLVIVKKVSSFTTKGCSGSDSAFRVVGAYWIRWRIQNPRGVPQSEAGTEIEKEG